MATVFNYLIIFTKNDMTIVGVSFVRDKSSNSFPKLFIGHYARLTFVHKVSLYCFSSEFDAQVPLPFESIPITLFFCFIVLRFKLRSFHNCLAKVLIHERGLIPSNDSHFFFWGGGRVSLEPPVVKEICLSYSLSASDMQSIGF